MCKHASLERKDDEFSLTDDLIDDIPPYAILSHTWSADADEVTFKDLIDGTGKGKAGYNKIRFCGEQTKRNKLQYFWVDTCCIDKSNNTELSEAINSMFRWYREAAICYVYLSDVSTSCSDKSIQSSGLISELAFQKSRWFTRGWTLQELIAPRLVELFSLEGKRLGDKNSLVQQIKGITGIPITVLQGSPLSYFSISTRISWAENRETKRKEDKAYSLMGLFDVHMPLIYGEGREKAFIRLHDEIDKRSKISTANSISLDDLYKQDQSRICLTSLTPTDQESLRNIALTRHRSACQWFLSGSRFQAWITDDCSDVLYITANAGCGKTTLAAHVINTLQRKCHIDRLQDESQEEEKVKRNFLLYFFFQKANVDDEGTASAALRTIIGQLIQQMPCLYQLLQRQYDVLALKGHISWSWEPLLSVFLGMIRQVQDCPDSTTYIVLDGIDECSSDSRSNLLTCLDSLVRNQNSSIMNRQKSRLKVFITGRPDEEIFDIIPNSKYFEITNSFTAEDINTLVVASVEQLGFRRHLAPAVQSAIKNFLLANANGMFLWVVLVIQELDRRDERLTDSSVAERLRKVPLTMARTYESILENVPISRRDDMWRILRYMLVSFRVMRLVELKTILCIELNISEWYDFPGDMKQLCGSLIRITNEEVRFLHQSVRDFLNNYVEQISTIKQHYEIQITTVCLKYLLQDRLLNEVYEAYPDRIRILSHSEYRNSMHNVLTKWPFLSYSAEHWALHLKSMAPNDSKIIALTLKLLETQRNRDMLMRLAYFFTHHGSPGSPRDGTHLHIATYFNLYWFVAKYIKYGADVNDTADCGDTALVWGSEMGSTESIKLLLEAGADPNIIEWDDWSALHWAATNGHVDIDAHDHNGSTSRDWAISRGYYMVVAEIDRFRIQKGMMKSDGNEDENQELEMSSPPIIRAQLLHNGRLAIGVHPHRVAPE